MKPEWYIKISNQKEGPYTPIQLRHHPLVTPDTLVWKEGMPYWLPLRKIPELQDIFQDVSEEDTPGPVIKPKFKKPFENDELALDFRQDPYNLIWLLIILLAMFYVIYQVYHL